MIELVVGIVGIILLYFLGHLIYPEPQHKTITPEPWQIQYQKFEEQRRDAEDE